MKLWFNGFADCVLSRTHSPVRGESNFGKSKTIQGDAVDVARCVKLMAHGELVPIKQLQFGVDASDMDVVDVQAEQMSQQTQPASKSENKPEEKPAQEPAQEPAKEE